MTGAGGRVALATAGRLPNGMADTPGLVAALWAQGVDPEVVAWDDAGVDWSAFGAVITHCTWDYLQRRAEFLDWLRGRHGDRTLANPLPVLEACLDKAYLLRLSEQGIAVPATVRLERGDGAAPDSLAERFGRVPLVVKPAIGGGGHQVWRCAGPREAAQTARVELAAEAVVVQEFLPSVTAGEYSAVFVSGRLSHAVRKRPAAGDFRVHRRYGASRDTVRATGWMADYGRRVFSALGTVPMYARVDFLLPAPQTPVLMEVEMLEPDLYLREHPGSAARLATALAGHARLTAWCSAG